MIYFIKRQIGGIQMKKRVLPILLITAAVVALIAYNGEDSEAEN